MAKTAKAAVEKKEKVAATSDNEAVDEVAKPKKRGPKPKENGVQKAKKATAKPKASGTAENKAKKTTVAKMKAPATRKAADDDADDDGKKMTIGEMTRKTLVALKTRKGVTLDAIRKHIAKKYEREMTKNVQNLIKKFIKTEFEEGRIRMANFEADEINFTKRFSLVN